MIKMKWKEENEKQRMKRGMKDWKPSFVDKIQGNTINNKRHNKEWKRSIFLKKNKYAWGCQYYSQ